MPNDPEEVLCRKYMLAYYSTYPNKYVEALVLKPTLETVGFKVTKITTASFHIDDDLTLLSANYPCYR